MGVTVLTPARSQDLTTLARAKSFLGVSDTSQDEILGLLIPVISSAINQEFARPLVRQQYQETLPGHDRHRVALKRWPVDVNSVVVEIDGEAVTDFTVQSSESGILFRETGWPAVLTAPGEDGEPNTEITYKAGYLFAPMVLTWAAGVVRTLGDWVKPTVPGALRFECTTAGTSHAATEPTWPTTAGLTVTDGTNTVWTARDARELPPAIEQLAWLALADLSKRRTTPGFLTSWTLEGAGESYSVTGAEGVLPKAVLDGCARWRYIL